MGFAISSGSNLIASAGQQADHTQNASDLRGTRARGIEELADSRLVSDLKRGTYKEGFTPEAAGEIIGAALRDRPELLQLTVPALGSRVGVSAKDINDAFGKFSKETGVTLSEGGKPKTIERIINEGGPKLATAQGKKAIEALPESIRDIVVGVALGATLAKDGLAGLAKFGLKGTVFGDANGKVNVALVPSGNSAAVRLDGTVVAKLGSDVKLSLKGDINTSGNGSASAKVEAKISSDVTATVDGQIGIGTGASKLALGLTAALSKTVQVDGSATFGDSNEYELGAKVAVSKDFSVAPRFKANQNGVEFYTGVQYRF